MNETKTIDPSIKFEIAETLFNMGECRSDLRDLWSGDMFGFLRALYMVGVIDNEQREKLEWIANRVSCRAVKLDYEEARAKVEEILS